MDIYCGNYSCCSTTCNNAFVSIDTNVENVFRKLENQKNYVTISIRNSKIVLI